MKQRVLITGASGFVGYHLVKQALENNLNVYAAVRKNSKIDQLKDFDLQYTSLAYNNVDALISEIKDKQYHYIIHAAGVTSARSQQEYNTINALYTYNLAKAAEACGVKKFIFLSSLAAIGPLENLNGVITEDTPPKPFTCYGKSKLMAEQKIASLPALDYTILRPTAVYGPHEVNIFIFYKQVAKGVEPYIGRIAQKLSFIYATDLAHISIKALQGISRSTYNISDGNFYDRYALGDVLKRLLGVRTFKFHLPVNFVKIVAAVAGKVSSLRGKAAVVNVEKITELIAVNWDCDIAKARAELGFNPRYDLSDGLKESVTWYKEHKWL